MSQLQDGTVEAFVIASLSINGLDISSGNREAILDNVRSLAKAFALVRSFEAPDELNAAPIFQAQ